MIDIVGEELRRLIAFTGLKIVNIDVGDCDITINLKLGRKRFKLWVCNGEMILYDSKEVVVCIVRPKQLLNPQRVNIPSITILDTGTLTQPYTITTTGGSSVWYGPDSSPAGNWIHTGVKV